MLWIVSYSCIDCATFVVLVVAAFVVAAVVAAVVVVVVVVVVAVVVSYNPDWIRADLFHQASIISDRSWVGTFNTISISLSCRY